MDSTINFFNATTNESGSFFNATTTADSPEFSDASITADPTNAVSYLNNATTAGPKDSTCPLFEDAFKCDVVTNIKRASVALTCLGSVVTIGLIVLFRKYREPSQRMIAHLSLAAMLYGLSYIVEDRIVTEATVLCKLQGFTIQLFAWTCFLWIVCMVLNLYVRLFVEFNFQKIERWVCLTCWILPVVIAFLPFIEDMYGPAGAWCWCKNDYAWRLGMWFGWSNAFEVIFAFVMCHMYWKLRSSKGHRHSSNQAMMYFKKDLQTLRIYPVVYFVTNIFPTLNRAHDAIFGSSGGASFTLMSLQAIMDPMFGVAFAVVYAFDSRTRNTLNRRDITVAFNRWFQKRSDIKEYSGSTSADTELSNVSGGRNDATIDMTKKV